MVSAAEQIASNINWNAFSRATELKKRLWFTIGALLIYRLGTYVPLPGIDPTIMSELAGKHSTGVLGFLDRFTGGALGRMSVFALGVMPYISASIIMQLLTSVSPQLGALKKEGESGRKKINQYTRYGTVLLCLSQAFGISVGLEYLPGGSPVVDPGLFFRLTSTITLTGGTLFLMWLGEQMTARGIGNGISLLIFSGIVANLPGAVFSTLELGRKGALDPLFITFIFFIVIFVITFIVFIERAQRRIFIQYPKRQVGRRITSGESSHLPMRLNVSGVIPPIFASSLLALPMTLTRFYKGGEGVMAGISYYLQPGNYVHMLLFIALIIFFAFFYTAIVFNPTETAENLRKQGGFVPGYRPGINTANYFDFVLTRLTVVGSLYLSFICVLPEIFFSKYHIPFTLGGTSLLIVVSVSMDTVAQIHSHLLSHQYEGLLKKMNLRGRR